MESRALDLSPYNRVIHFIDADLTVYNRGYHKANIVYETRRRFPAEEAKRVVDSNTGMISCIADMINKCGNGQIQSGSLRIAPHLDAEAGEKNSTGHFSDALAALHQEVQAQTGSKCKLETFLPVDAYSRVVAEPTKFTHHYLRLQRLAYEYPGETMLVVIWDDYKDSNGNVHDCYTAFQNHAEWYIPNNIAVCFIQHPRRDQKDYVLYSVGDNYPVIRGKGVPNERYSGAIAALAPFLNKLVQNDYKYDDHATLDLTSHIANSLKSRHGALVTFLQALNSPSDQTQWDFNCEQGDDSDLYPIFSHIIMQRYGEQFYQPDRQGNLYFLQHFLLLYPMLQNKVATQVTLDICLVLHRKRQQKEIMIFLVGRMYHIRCYDELLKFVEQLMSEKYKCLVYERRERSWFTNPTWKGEPVSQDFSDLVKFAKKNMMLLLKQKAISPSFLFFPDKTQHEEKKCVAFLQERRSGKGVKKDQHYETRSYRTYMALSVTDEKKMEQIRKDILKDSLSLRNKYR